MRLIDEVVEPYRIGLAGRCRIETAVPESLPLLMVDKGVLARALTNIIENALHAMPGGGTLRFERAAQDESARAAGDHRYRRRAWIARRWVASSSRTSRRGQRHRPGADHREAQRRTQRRHDHG